MGDLTEQSLKSSSTRWERTRPRRRRHIVGDHDRAGGGAGRDVGAALIRRGGCRGGERECAGDALRLAEQELTAYEPVLKAETPADRTTALDGASEPPAQMAETAADVAELGVKVAESSSPAVRGDALTGVILAESAAAAAARLVWTNITSGPVFDRARAAAERASKARRIRETV